MISFHTFASLLFSLSTVPPKELSSPEKIKSKRYGPNEAPPPAIFTARIHPLEPEVSAEVNSFFLDHWHFDNEKAKKKFVAAGFSRVTCFYYPVALNDRIAFACRLLTLLFLIDGN